MKKNYGGALRVKIENTTMGFWDVLEYLGHGNYSCRCACGKRGIVAACSLMTRSSRSCGCKMKELREEAKKKIKEKRAPFVPGPKYE